MREVFISQPMNGKSDGEIKAARENSIKKKDNEIMKALKYCVNGVAEGCKRCPYGGTKWCITDTQNKLLIDTLDLINRQKAEIERLKGSVITNNIMETQRIKREAKSEAIKEFAERLKETITNAINTYYNSNGGGYYLAEDVIEDIDNLVKEMTEVQNNDNI